MVINDEKEIKLAKFLKDWGEPITKTLSLGAIFLYATGLFLSGCYYSQRGVPAFSFVQPVYVLTGFLFWLPFIIFIACLEVFKFLNEHRSRSVAIVGAIFISIFSASFLIPFLSSTQINATVGHGDMTVTPNLFLAFRSIILMSGLVGFGAFAYYVVKKEENQQMAKRHEVAKGTNKISGKVFMVPVVLFLGGIYFNFFLAGLMPAVTQSLGGGAPRPVEFLLEAKEAKDAVPPVPLLLNTNEFDYWLTFCRPIDRTFYEKIDFDKFPAVKTTLPYWLVFENDSDYYILVGQSVSSSVLKIPKSTVQGIIYLPPTPDGTLNAELAL